ncbi:VOC family protein [Sodalis sp. RH15]|uniref:VOC family protein n=1 Tax=Sodalis sp. RH15 TaxID=3394330 RepID=UPI0039B57CE4
MSRVQAVDHLVVSVSDFAVSRKFYSGLFDFLGFEIMNEMPEAMGWSNGNTRFWIYQADQEGKKHPYRKGDIGFHHYAWSLNSRKDVDELQAWLERSGAEIADPAGEYYDDYYAVFFLDPDGMKLEGMHYGK